MSSDRSSFQLCVRVWERRIGIRLDAILGHYDPVKETNSHLYPNDHRKAWLIADDLE